VQGDEMGTIWEASLGAGDGWPTSSTVVLRREEHLVRLGRGQESKSRRPRRG
jgi:hypothetical protein